MMRAQKSQVTVARTPKAEADLDRGARRAGRARRMAAAEGR